MSELYIIYKDKSGTETLVAFDVVTSINHKIESEASEFVLEDGSVITDHIINKRNELSFTVQVTNTPHQNNPKIPQNNGELSWVPQQGKITSVSLPYPDFLENKIEIPDIKYYEPGMNLAQVGSTLNLQSALSAGVSAITGNTYKKQPVRDNKFLTFPKKPNKYGATVWQPDNAKNRAQEMFNILQMVQLEHLVCSIITREKYYTNMYIVNVSSPKSPNIGESLIFDIVTKELKTVGLLTVGPLPADILAQNQKQIGSKNVKANPQKEQEAQKRQHTTAVKLGDTNGDGIVDSRD